MKVSLPITLLEVYPWTMWILLFILNYSLILFTFTYYLGNMWLNANLAKVFGKSINNNREDISLLPHICKSLPKPSRICKITSL